MIFKSFYRDYIIFNIQNLILLEVFIYCQLLYQKLLRFIEHQMIISSLDALSRFELHLIYADSLYKASHLFTSSLTCSNNFS